jgi:hypothetical protein
MKYYTSPDLYSFYQKCDKKNLEEGNMTQENYDKWKTFWEIIKVEDSRPTIDLPDLECELRTSDYIHNKCVASEQYCKDLYAALCNNEFIKNNKECSYSWRRVGGIISNILERGDYIDWYLSGNEGYTTPEIEKDITDMGWKIVPMVIGD